MVEARYDAVADFYEVGWSGSDDPATAVLLDLLGRVSGLRVLDVACGHGRISRELARRGASVVGVDVSAALIGKAVAAERDEPLGVRYICADLASPGWLGGATFDAVVCNFGLSDVDDLDGAVDTVGRALVPAGCFVFSMLHPCFPGGRDVSGSWPAGGTYYGEVRWFADGAASSLRHQVGANHRMLSTYFTALGRRGLWVDAVAEPSPPPGWALTRPDAARHPVFLVARCRRGRHGGHDVSERAV